MSNAPDLVVLPSEDQPEHARHRSGRRLHRGATVLTAVVAAGAVALATYAGTPSAPELSADGPAESVADASPFAGNALRSVTDGLGAPLEQSLSALQAERSDAALNFSAWSALKAGDVAAERSEEIAAERAAAEKAAAEKAAAEKAAAEQAAAEQAAAEQAAAEREAAEEAAAAPAPREESASRSQERAEAPAEPAPAPVSSGDPRSIARSMLGSYGWGSDQFGCLDSLWMRESGWNHTAQNPSSGAYGIPQALPGTKMATAGADWRTNPATQISWGLSYISGRYGTPCGAWAHSESVGWY